MRRLPRLLELEEREIALVLGGAICNSNVCLEVRGEQRTRSFARLCDA